MVSSASSRPVGSRVTFSSRTVTVAVCAGRDARRGRSAARSAAGSGSGWRSSADSSGSRTSSAGQARPGRAGPGPARHARGGDARGRERLCRRVVESGEQRRASRALPSAPRCRAAAAAAPARRSRPAPAPGSCRATSASARRQQPVGEHRHRPAPARRRGSRSPGPSSAAQARLARSRCRVARGEAPSRSSGAWPGGRDQVDRRTASAASATCTWRTAAIRSRIVAVPGRPARSVVERATPSRACRASPARRPASG